MRVDNSRFDNSDYDPGRGFFFRALWYCINALVFKTYIFPFYGLKANLLCAFGASVGAGLVIKPNVNIKYPWLLSLGENVWIGEGAWIDNLSTVDVGNNVCIYQDAFILTGNHDYSMQSFDLIVKNVTIEDGVWIGAKSIVCPGIVCESHSILTVGSVATKNLDAFTIYSGLPAMPIRERVINT